MIEINGSPLFGKDSSPQNFSAFFSLIGTLVVFLAFILCLIFVKGEPKAPKYKEVQIVLEAPLPPKKVEEKPKPKEEEINPPIAEEVVEELPPPVVEEDVKPKEETKTVTPKKEVAKPKPEVKPKPVPKKEIIPEVKQEQKVEPPKIYESVEDKIKSQLQQTQKKSVDDFDWSMFGDSSTSTSTSSSKKVTTESSIAGSLGKVSEDNSQRITSEVQKEKDNSTSSSSTESLLKEIINTSYKSKTKDSGTISETKIDSATNDGKVVIKMDDGRPRRLLSPKTPVIELSEDAISKIDGSKTVTISIKVLSFGAVGEVKIIPEASLPQLARSEIVNQIKKWSFEPSDYDATAQFEYKIVKK